MNRKLVLYSDQTLPENRVIGYRLLELLKKNNPRLGYIPSSYDPERFYFAQTHHYYATLGVSLQDYFDYDTPLSSETALKLFDCDAIHLSGGNTFHFLHWLRNRNMPQVLKDYVAEGGVLIGVSAGAILMTPDISTTTLCGDEEPSEPIDKTSLGLVDFQFLPHFESNTKMSVEVSKLPSEYGNIVYGCPDGCGVVVDGSDIEVFGDVETFELL
jgi:dipeptidase E